MKKSEIRGLSQDALVARIHDTSEELRNLRFQQATGELTDTSRLRLTKRTLACLLTLLNERKSMESMEGEQ